jgi:hypothetical protein
MMNVIGWSLVAGEPLSGTMAGGLDRDGRGALAQLARPQNRRSSHMIQG